MRVTYGRGGWVGVDDTGLPGPIYLRFFATGGIAELVFTSLSHEDPLTAKYLRGLPLANIASVAMSRPDLMLATGPASEGPDVRALLQEAAPFPIRWKSQHDTTARLAPPVAGLTDAFLRDVARAYTAAIARGERPNQALAAQVGFPPAKRQATVERWVYLARKAGHLPPARKGGVA